MCGSNGPGIEWYGNSPYLASSLISSMGIGFAALSKVSIGFYPSSTIRTTQNMVVRVGEELTLVGSVVETISVPFDAFVKFIFFCMVRRELMTAKRGMIYTLLCIKLCMNSARLLLAPLRDGDVHEEWDDGEFRVDSRHDQVDHRSAQISQGSGESAALHMGSTKRFLARETDMRVGGDCDSITSRISRVINLSASGSPDRFLYRIYKIRKVKSKSVATAVAI